MNKNIARSLMKQFYRGNKAHFALAAMHSVLMAAVNLLGSWLLQQIIDLISGVNTGLAFSRITAIALGCFALQVIAYLFAYSSKPRFISKAIGQYKIHAFKELSQKGINAFSKENTSLYISALSNDAAAIESNYLANLFIMIDGITACFSALLLMFWYSPALTLISMSLSVIPLTVSILTGNLVAAAEKKVSNQNTIYMSTLKDSLTGFSVMKSFRAEAQMLRIFSKNVRAVSNAGCLRRKMSVLVEMLSSSAGVILQFGVFLIGAFLALSKGAISAGTVLVFMQLLNYVLYPVSVIPQCLAERRAAKALIAKLANALGENVRDDGKQSKQKLHRQIELREVSFAYDADNPVLQNVNLRFTAGKSYAVVGPSGSGKTTLLNLLIASRNDYSGSIYYDDTELRHITGNSLYDMVSVIQQNVFIFDASIRDNITMFTPFPREEVDRVIELSGLSEFIALHGDDYLCGENGNGLSGGEKQRISIARSLLRKSQVLLVDEATAALDAETACHVSSSILELEKITRIVVTHALDRKLLQKYDEIIVLKNGTVKEQGSFNSLMEQKNYFYSLFTVAQ